MLHILAIFSRFRRLLCGIADDRYYSLDLDVIGSGTTTTTSRMPSSSSTPSASTTPAGSTTKARSSTRHAAPLPPISASPGTTSAAVSPAPGLTPISSTTQSPNPNVTLSPTATSKLPRFLQSPAARDRSKSLSVDRPPSAASSHTSHSTHASNATSNSNSTSASGRKSATRFLGIGKDRERERERARIREAERSAPSAQELLAASPTEYDDDFAPGGPPSAFIHNGGGTARPRPRTRSERHFSASTPPSSSSSSSNGHSHPNPHGNPELALARTPSRLGVSDGALATRLSGWFAHLAGSTSDLSLTGTIGGSLSNISHTAAALSPTSRKSSSAHGHTSHSHHSTKKGGGDGGVTSKGAAKTSLLDKAVRYLLDGDAAPDRSTEEIWLMGVQLPGWGAEDEARVAAAAHGGGKDHSSHLLSTSHGAGHGLSSSKRRSTSRQRDLPPPPPTGEVEGDPNAEEEDVDTAPPDPGPWPALFHAAFYAHVWCTYRAGFEPIRDLPSLGSLPPPLAFAGSPHAVSHSPSAHGSTSSVGREGMTSSGSTGTTLVPTSPRGAAGRGGAGRGGGGGGGGSDSSASDRHSQAGSNASYASYSGSSYASYSGGVGESSGGSAGVWAGGTLITAVFERLQHEKEVVAPLPQQRNGRNERLDERRRVGMYVTDEPELARDGVGTGWW
ncbi:hypothetical protein MSAN_02514800 [Mycena sanguinolenta]|uniref:Uncharacterized protein n=1 Tax=Mycena sanguinolenta TaxID=230812 RepID=A0A8H6U127_9AGAR|nr:hypothetical protein MSAN_02514800 [Mycena sanguinolenta]